MKTLRTLTLICLVGGLAACATGGPKRTVTVDTLTGTSWAGVWGSDGGHGMQNALRLTVEQADLGAVLGAIVITNQGRDYAFPAKGLIERKEGADWIRLTVEGDRSFELKLLGDRLEGRGTSPIHRGPVTLELR